MFKRKVNEGQLLKVIGVAGHRARDPPEPIPNSAVKPCSVPGFSVVFGHAKAGKLAAPSLFYDPLLAIEVTSETVEVF